MHHACTFRHRCWGWGARLAAAARALRPADALLLPWPWRARVPGGGAELHCGVALRPALPPLLSPSGAVRFAPRRVFRMHSPARRAPQFAVVCCVIKAIITIYYTIYTWIIMDGYGSLATRRSYGVLAYERLWHSAMAGYVAMYVVRRLHASLKKQTQSYQSQSLSTLCSGP